MVKTPQAHLDTAAGVALAACPDSYIGVTSRVAGNPQDALRTALRVAEQHTSGEIALLLTDVIMPEMGGKELAQQFRAAYPGAKVLFCSGYTQEAIDRGGELEPGIALLQKPFTPASLSHKIREVLNR